MLIFLSRSPRYASLVPSRETSNTFWMVGMRRPLCVWISATATASFSSVSGVKRMPPSSETLTTADSSGPLLAQPASARLNEATTIRMARDCPLGKRGLSVGFFRCIGPSPGSVLLDYVSDPYRSREGGNVQPRPGPEQEKGPSNCVIARGRRQKLSPAKSSCYKEGEEDLRGTFDQAHQDPRARR